VTSASTPYWSQLLGVAVKHTQNFFSMKFAKTFGYSNINLSDSSTKIKEFSSEKKSSLV
jgi:hypothetical protein